MESISIPLSSVMRTLKASFRANLAMQIATFFLTETFLPGALAYSNTKLSIPPYVTNCDEMGPLASSNNGMRVLQMLAAILMPIVLYGGNDTVSHVTFLGYMNAK